MAHPHNVLLARSAMLRGFKEQATAAGLDAEGLAAEFGVEAAALTNPDLHVSAEAVASLYEAAAERSRLDDFALNVVSRRRMSNLGVIALLAREEPTLRQALRSVQRYLWIQTEGLDVVFERTESDVLFRAVPHILLGRQAIDLCVGMALVTVRALIGGSWNPQRILLPYAEPGSLRAYHQVFRMKPRFDQDQTGIVLTESDLAIRIATADPDFVTQIRPRLEEATRTRTSGFVASVRILIAQQLGGGRCGVDQIADALGLSRRSLQRQLAEHDVSFTALVDATRRSQVVGLLMDSSRSVQRVSDLLGFSNSASFNHWFRRGFGCSPSAYRARRLASGGE